MKVEIQTGFPETEVLIKCQEVTDDVTKIERLLLHEFGQKLYGTKDGATHLISKSEVLYFESIDKRCFLYTVGDVYETSLKLYEVENMLTSAGFFRSSKSQILNIAQIDSLRPDFEDRLAVTMKNGEKAMVSRSYARQLKERLGL